MISEPTTEKAQQDLSNLKLAEETTATAIRDVPDETTAAKPEAETETAQQPAAQTSTGVSDQATEVRGDQEMKDGMVVANQLGDLRQMYEKHNTMKGFKPASIIAEAEQNGEESKDQKLDQPRVLVIPDSLFADFKYIAEENEKLFEYVAFFVTIQFLEKLEDDKWALQYPACIPSDGRRLLHDVANYFGLAHHSGGKAGKTRKTMMYPTTQFLEKQEIERRRLEKEQDKIREKFKNQDLIGTPLENPKTFREQVIRQIWEERQNGGVHTTQTTTNMLLDKPKLYKADGSDFVEVMKPLIEAKKKELEESEFAKMEAAPTENVSTITATEDQTEKVQEAASSGPSLIPQGDATAAQADKAPSPEVAKPAMTPSATSVPGPVPSKTNSAGDKPVEKDGDAEEELTEEDIQQKVKHAILKKQEAEQMQQYRQRLQSATLENFQDIPDEVSELRVLQTFARSVMLEWSMPCDNQSPITHFNVYFKSVKGDSKFEKHGETEITEYMMTNLQPESCYYIMVTAQSVNGEGYKAKQQFFAITMADNLNQTDSIYVWGNNSSSELGLTDDIVEENKAHFVKSVMTKPVRHHMFGSMVYQIAPGNVNTMVLCANTDDQSTFMVTCGMTCSTIEGEEEVEKNELTIDEVSHLEDVASIPYQIDFEIPVVKVVCGDLFSGLLTAEGQVFTWGYNHYGQLGTNNEKTKIVQRPMHLEFENKSVNASTAKFFIKDIACGYNHCLALTAEGQIFVWGRRMGIYPNFEMSAAYLSSKFNTLSIEINQSYPRLLKNNLIFYKIKSLACGPFNSALITEDGHVLLQGMNDYGQLALGDEFGGRVPFFPEFRKLDYFSTRGLKAIGVGLGATSSHFLCHDASQGKNRFFGVGCGEVGQLGNGSKLTHHNPVDVSDMFPTEVTQISAGGFHVLALTSENKVYGFGKCSKSQLGYRYKVGEPKAQFTPVHVELPAGKVTRVACGSLFSMAQMQEPAQ